MDPISKLIDNVNATQKRKDDLTLQVKTFDTLIMTYDMEFAKLQQKETTMETELKSINEAIKLIEIENNDLKTTEKNQAACRSKMLLTLQSIAAKKEEMKKLIEDECKEQQDRIEGIQAKYDLINHSF